MIPSLTIAQLRAQYQQGLKPSVLAETLLARCADRGDDGTWWYRLAADEVLAAARRLDHQDPASLPLYGIPFAVKDNIDVAPYPTSAACPAFSYPATTTATAVTRLLEAGALLIGKTNLDQFATGLVGTRTPRKAPRSVFHPDYISGGSSSGSAVAVASGLVSFALGTDTAGSGRVPAAFNNIVGLKPSRGLVSNSGVVPACRSLDCVSVFSLNCADSYRVLQTFAGPDSSDPYSRELALETPLSVPWPELRIAIPEPLEFYGDTQAEAAFYAFRERLVVSGAQVLSIPFAPFQAVARLLYDGPWIAERYAAVGEFIDAHPAEVLEVTRRIIQSGAELSAVQAFQGQYRLQQLIQDIAILTQDIDLLLTPTVPRHYRYDEVAAEPMTCNSQLGHYTNFVNLLDYCALTVPAGFRDDGLPSGVTLNAPLGRDGWLAGIGHQCHALATTPLGASNQPLADWPRPAASETTIPLAVCGAHLEGLALNHQLTDRGGRRVITTTTAPCYRLYALEHLQPPRPGLVRDDGGAAIAVEVWNLSPAAFGDFVAQIPPPLGIGKVELADGSWVPGFLCEPHVLGAGREITQLGGWRAYLVARG